MAYYRHLYPLYVDCSASSLMSITFPFRKFLSADPIHYSFAYALLPDSNRSLRADTTIVPSYLCPETFCLQLAAMSDEWERHKNTILRLYLMESMSLNKVVEYMEKNHNFDKKLVWPAVNNQRVRYRSLVANVSFSLTGRISTSANSISGKSAKTLRDEMRHRCGSISATTCI